MNTTTTTAKPAIWFSRHAPSPGQLAEITERGFTLARLEEGIALGSVSLNSLSEASEMISKVNNIARAEGARAVFGVFPTAFLASAWAGAAGYLVMAGDFWRSPVTLFGSINIQRTPEGGGRPTFEHGSWEEVGAI